ncbi:MAG: putative lipid II flippase FtsW [Gammaproteobacteria bacterium]|jgi:cell division protein FtsW|uniref:putative lipid II flippase FtsW n=1 Tax=Marinomonas TaxID=28253 RepID=UPI000C1E1E20|nr:MULTISPECIES: putative lipid II flippase FtsW [unclassified Marinomonas]MBU1294329.1 putative lipid II flippase FtsW [Gammaproteobacteria bacterium]MBU1465654.1 putative lipid II flippase FtsW [Gammaproteobacteria bacterium]MBU2022125.1 putative lipid II flippase FtsW [Gammaproteobacteria bacterium]MBU2237553.1 putative lipid II flippase FtsW [Gammaproteobacteria bacterium]MBU2318374.1 putative lipid II flippase FtsW [Gammaproteobacteria bacterium]
MTWLKIFDRVSLREFAQVDAVFVAAVVSILALGMVMVSSASISISETIHGQPYFFMVRQGLYLAIGLVFGWVLLSLPTHQLQKWGILMMGLSLILLILVLMPGIGKSVNGSRRWINLVVFNLQASEVAKVCMVVYVSGYLVRRADRVREGWVGFVLPLCLCSIFLLFLLFEPDFGASVVLLGTVMVLLFLGGAPLYQFLLLMVGAVSMLGVVAISESYRLKRLMNFIDPWADPFNEGYQLSQALIAYGRGEWFGLGLGNSVQKLSYLPEAHTDFVFSIWVEETGMFGGLLLICLFALMVARAFKIGRQAMTLSRPFAAYMCFGFSILILAQVIINIGVNTGFLPTKGLTLPLISYGGSSLIITLGSLFVVARVDIENRRAEKGDGSGESIKMKESTK